jgi:hypothetical protein
VLIERWLTGEAASLGLRPVDAGAVALVVGIESR